MTDPGSYLFSIVRPPDIDIDGDDWLRLEQKKELEPAGDGFMDWLRAKGYDLFNATPAFSLEYQEKFKSLCDDSGCLEVELQVHKSRPGLQYNLSASWGVLSDRFVHTTEHTQSETIKMQSEFDLGVLVKGAVRADWEGLGGEKDKVLNEDGQLIAAPEVTRSGSILTWGGIKVAGVLRLRFSEEHDTYILTITPRSAAESDPEDLRSAYQSTCFAVWGKGQIEEVDVELPEIKGNCRGGSVVHVNPDDPKKDECYDLYVEYHQCKPDVVLSEKLVKVACPEVDAGDTDEDS